MKRRVGRGGRGLVTARGILDKVKGISRKFLEIPKRDYQGASGAFYGIVSGYYRSLFKVF